MITKDRERLIYHGAIVMFIGLLCGYPAVVEAGEKTPHMWRATHLELIMIGIWILATAAVVPSLVLPRREAAGLVWSLIATGYGLIVGLLIGAVTGVRAMVPVGPLINLIGFAGNATGILGSLLATLLTIKGARAALKQDRTS